MTRLLRVVAAATLLALWQPVPAVADHCGSDAMVSPTSGRPGTTFIFRTFLGAPSDLRIYRNDILVREVELAGQGFDRYRIRTGPGDGGQWRARAEVKGRPDCAAEATFTVIVAPDTSAEQQPGSESDAPGGLLIAASILGMLVALRSGRSPAEELVQEAPRVE